MEDKNLWKHLEKHLLGCFVRARARLNDLHHGTGCEISASASSMVCTGSGCVKGLEVSVCGRKEEKQTWMLSWSDCQGSMVTVLGWLGTCTVLRDLPQNMRAMGDSTELAYSCPYIRQLSRGRRRETRDDPTHSVVLLFHFSLTLSELLYTRSRDQLVRANISL